MPTPTRALTNDFKDCNMVKLDAGNPGSPYVVMQVGYAPGDPTCQMRLFYLQHDGMWIDEIARSTVPDRESGDVVFETVADVMKVLSGLFGKPIIRELPVSKANVEAYVGRLKIIGSPKDALRDFLARYRRATGGSNP